LAYPWSSPGKLYRDLLGFLASPPQPDRSEKAELIELESLLISNPQDSQYSFNSRRPLTCGSIPRQVPIEVRVKGWTTAITYWYYWDHDIVPGDHEDWEPVSLVYTDGRLVRAYSRAHNALVEYTKFPAPQVIVYFDKYGHTPAINSAGYRIVRGGSRPIAEWLKNCQKNAAKLGWAPSRHQVSLASTPGPKLDQSSWKTWGKHAVFLEL
jgi:hypothetical protein